MESVLGDCCCRLDWPVRALSFSHDGKMLASASEDLVIDICEVSTGVYTLAQNMIFDRIMGL